MRRANEDRISINYRISKPDYKECGIWPNLSYFGLFDGHAGDMCANFLRDNLLELILKQSSFPSRPVDAIKAGFAEAEQKFLALASNGQGSFNRSGSCANVVMIIDDICFVANVGDSRAVMSSECGMRVYGLSEDHKPNSEKERDRIEKKGGKVYSNEFSPGHSNAPVIHRVVPGRLSVSRAFGDADAKLKFLGGKPGVVIAEPDVKSFRISKKYDFIVMGSDGIFDRLSNADVVKTVWSSIESTSFSFHAACGESVKRVLKESMCRNSLDNVSAVLIAFSSLRHSFSKQTHRAEHDSPL